MTQVQIKAPALLDRRLAGLLSCGTWAAAGLIAIGLSLQWIGLGSASSGQSIVKGGIALLILLPVLRVIVMLVSFMIERDYRFSVIAGLVLTLIAAGFALGATAT
jgi:hypothetical protein